MTKPSMFVPSLLMPEIYFPFKNESGFTAGLIETFAEQGFYGSFEIGEIFDQAERKRILQAKERHRFILTQWLTFVLEANELDIASTDRRIRQESVRQVKENLSLAAECGVSNIALVTGPDPGPQHRAAAIEGLSDSLSSICQEASAYRMNVLIEPLDRFAHKKRLIGPTQEAVDLIAAVQRSHPNIGLAFDTAHAALNGENLFEAMSLSRDHIRQIHFSNAVLDPAHSLYGDRHMPIGEPGFLSGATIADVLRKAIELGIPSPDGLRVAVEVRGTDRSDRFANEKTARTVLESALQSV